MEDGLGNEPLDELRTATLYYVYTKFTAENNGKIIQVRECKYSIYNIGIGAQSTLGSKTFLPKNMHENLTKCPNFT